MQSKRAIQPGVKQKKYFVHDSSVVGIHYKNLGLMSKAVQCIYKPEEGNLQWGRSVLQCPFDNHLYWLLPFICHLLPLVSST